MILFCAMDYANSPIDFAYSTHHSGNVHIHAFCIVPTTTSTSTAREEEDGVNDTYDRMDTLDQIGSDTCSTAGIHYIGFPWNFALPTVPVISNDLKAKEHISEHFVVIPVLSWIQRTKQEGHVWYQLPDMSE
jgi:hypothetical protein